MKITNYIFLGLLTFFFIANGTNSLQSKPSLNTNIYFISGTLRDTISKSQALAAKSPFDAVKSISNGVGVQTSGLIAANNGIMTSSILVNKDNSIYDLVQLMEFGFQQSSQCPATSCINGIPLQDRFGRCYCKCINLHWSGDQCNIHDCFGNGIFDIITQTCACSVGENTNTIFADWSLCSLQISMSQLSPFQPGCELGIFGQSCQIRCGTHVIDGNSCPVRSNWMHDECVDVSDGTTQQSACFCGASFNPATPRSVDIKFMLCDGSVEDCAYGFTTTSSVCCSPSVDCSSHQSFKCSSTAAKCCSEGNTNPSLCHAIGCFHNGAYCLPLIRQYTSTAQIISNQNWYRTSKICSFSEPSSVCRKVLQLQYNQLLSECSNQFNLSCAENLRRAINAFSFSAADAFSQSIYVLRATRPGNSIFYFVPSITQNSKWTPLLSSNDPIQIQVIKAQTSISLYPSSKYHIFVESQNKYYCVSSTLMEASFGSDFPDLIDLTILSGYVMPLSLCQTFPVTLSQTIYDLVPLLASVEYSSN